MTLDELISGLNNLDGQIQTKVVEKVAPVIKGLLDQQIGAGTDPKGTPWIPNKDGSKPLDGIQKYVHVKPEGDSIVVRLDEPASYHQTGTKTLPRRQIVPTDDLPITWEVAIQGVVDEVISDGSLNLR